MSAEDAIKKSQLINSLREAVGIVQMILFKEIKATIEQKKPNLEKTEISMLAGAITNEVFGTPNPETKFSDYRNKHKSTIEQELLALKDTQSSLCRFISDALRIQTLCDNQEGIDSTETLIRAKSLGYLVDERDIPLPSTFMTIVRELGKQHNLIIPPTQITEEEDQQMIH